MKASITVWALDGIPEVVEGDDLTQLILDTGVELADGDVVIVTSKVVSKAEGRLVSGTREDHLAAETARVVARRGRTQIVQTKHGFVLAAAGIDASNVPVGSVALLPVDPDGSARRIRDAIRARVGVDVAVIVTDTAGRAWRHGQTDIAIGAAGLEVAHSYAGSIDAYGNEAALKKQPLSEVHLHPEGITGVTCTGEEIEFGEGDVPGKLARLARVRKELKDRSLVAEVIHLDNRARPSRIAVQLSSRKP